MLGYCVGKGCSSTGKGSKRCPVHSGCGRLSLHITSGALRHKVYLPWSRALRLCHGLGKVSCVLRLYLCCPCTRSHQDLGRVVLPSAPPLLDGPANAATTAGCSWQDQDGCHLGIARLWGQKDTAGLGRCWGKSGGICSACASLRTAAASQVVHMSRLLLPSGCDLTRCGPLHAL